MSVSLGKDQSLWVKSTQKGATWRFSFSVADRSEESKQYVQYMINNNTQICFSVESRQNDQFILRTQLRKVNVSINTTYKMNIICKDVDYSNEHVCHEYWSDEIDIGIFEKNHQTEVAIIYVTSYKYTTSTAGLLKFFDDSDLTDFHLSIGEGSVAVHRAYLAARSDIFKAMLTGKWKETDTGIIEMKDVSLQTLKYLKEYLYLGTLPGYDGLRPLLALASQYCVEDLKSECITKLALTVLPKDLYSLLDFACDFKLPELCFAVTHLTPDHVVHESYQLQEKLEGTKKAVEKVASVTE